MPLTNVAVYSQSGLYHDMLGRLEQGYNIITIQEAEAWIQVSKKVRLASPQEVANAYGV